MVCGSPCTPSAHLRHYHHGYSTCVSARSPRHLIPSIDGSLIDERSAVATRDEWICPVDN